MKTHTSQTNVTFSVVVAFFGRRLLAAFCEAASTATKPLIEASETVENTLGGATTAAMIVSSDVGEL